MSIKLFFIVIFISLLLTSCSKDNKKEVIIYTSVDQVFSSKILKEFEEKTGIKIKAVYDTEASKAVGLEKRLLAEKKHPKADVFWNSENLRTTRLDSHALFTPQLDKVKIYKKLDSHHFSKDATYFGMGIRSRVFIVNTNLLDKSSYPSKLEDIINPKYKAKVAIANPLFGTASAQFSALLAKWGEKKFIKFLQALKKNEVAILSGNSTVKSAVGNGEYIFGLLDSDDALVGIKQGLPIKILYYNQEKEGSFSVYQTLCIIKNSKNQENAQKLFDYLLSSEVEKKLIAMDAVQYPILSNKTTDETPLLWLPSSKQTAKFLKRSSELIREYLD